MCTFKIFFTRMYIKIQTYTLEFQPLERSRAQTFQTYPQQANNHVIRDYFTESKKAGDSHTRSIILARLCPLTRSTFH